MGGVGPITGELPKAFLQCNLLLENRMTVPFSRKRLVISIFKLSNTGSGKKTIIPRNVRGVEGTGMDKCTINLSDL